SRDHSERMLKAFGAEIERDGLTVSLEGWPDLRGQKIIVPGDISSAAFPIAAALLVPGSDITLKGVGMNPTRTGILELFDAMGADIERLNLREEGGEPVADLRVRHSALKGIEVPPEMVPKAIDEFPIFFTVAAFAEGESLVTGGEELRVKESDRIASMVKNLSLLGAKIEELPDGARIQGEPEGLAGDAIVDSHTDHRVAMSALIAGLLCRKPVQVTRCDNIRTSFPEFLPLMRQLGGMIDVISE
ncbi:3-phosphoshikimate 1-carboxyvinyltransferase, partial [Magnetococcales bacterium HHB-1]